MRSEVEQERVAKLLQAGMSDREISVRTGVPRRTISDWRRGKNQILQRSRSDHRCSQKHDFSFLPPRDYSYLLGLYLGDGCISAAGSRGVWLIRVTLDSAYPQIIDECRVAMEAVFPEKQARVGLRRHSRCVDVSMYSKHWPCFIPQHGPGRKHLRTIALRSWQETIVSANREPFIRGLIHSDGTRIVATERKGTYVRRAPRYAFSNKSEDIKALFCESCDALGIHWTRPSDREIAIYRLASVARLDEFVGPKR